MARKIGNDPVDPKGQGSDGFDPDLVSDIADALVSGQGLAKPGADPASAAIRDTGSDAMTATAGVGTVSDNFRKAVLRVLLDRDGIMVVPDGLTYAGAVFGGPNCPDGYEGLTVRGTTRYTDPDGGPFRYGVYIGKPDARAGKVRKPNGNGAKVDTAVASDAGKTPDAG